MLLVIEELEHGLCKWPVAEFEARVFLFCGDLTADQGRPYCVHHMALAYTGRPCNAPRPRPILAEMVGAGRSEDNSFTARRSTAPSGL